MAGLDPEPRLERGDRPERGGDLVERHVGGHLDGAGRPAAQGRERSPVHVGVLADLERCEMEPERAELPAQVGDLSERDPLEAVGDQRVLHLGQLGVELGRVRVPAADRRGLPGERGAGSTQPLGDEPEALPVGLVREAPAQQAVGLGERLRVARESQRQRRRDAIPRCRRRQRLHEPRGDRLVAVEHVLGLDPEGPLGHVRGHLWVAVPVAADPAPPVEVRPDARRPRPGQAGIGRGPETAPRGGGRRVEGAVERPVQAGHDREERGVEDRHRRAHLVERGGRHGTEVGGAPQERDLLAQSAADLAILRGREARVVQALQQPGAAAQGDQGRPPAGLGRVRGEDQGDGEPSEQLVESAIVGAAAAQRDHGLRHGIVEDAVACRAFATAECPDPATRLGQVDQLEVQGEGLDDRLGGPEVEVREIGVEPATLLGVVVLAQGDRPPADALHELEQVRSGLLGDHLAEERPQQADLRGERVVRPRGPDPGRFGAHRARWRAPLAGAHAAEPTAQPCGPQRFATFPASQPFEAITFPTLVR